MKKFAIISILMACILSVAGCTSGDKPDTTTSSEATTTQQTTVVTTLSTPKDKVAADMYEPQEDVTSSEEISSSPESVKEDIQIPENTNFRNTVWGMTIDEVKQIESLSLLPLNFEDTDYLNYSGDTIVGLPADVFYLFDDNGKLWRGGYDFTYTLDHTNENLYIDDYNKIVKGLTEVYGAPIFDAPYWSDDLFEDDPDDWGRAISYGHVSFNAQWLTPETEIWVYLSGDNYSISLLIYYDSLTYERVNESYTAGL